MERLVRCYRECVRLRDEGREFVVSRELGRRVGSSPSIVRKDLSSIGKLGTRGSGYSVAEIIGTLESLFDSSAPRNVVLVGAGNPGAALLNDGCFERHGFRLVAAFDLDPHVIGRRCRGLVLKDISAIPKVLGTLHAEIGVLAIPAARAEYVAEILTDNGVRAILDLTGAVLSPGEGVVVADVDLTVELEKPAFYR